MNKCGFYEVAYSQLIESEETRQQKYIARLTEQLVDSLNGGVRLVLIAGPSASGKTTIAKRLCEELKDSGFVPEIVSLDNYFLDREHTPLDENGEYDYESIDALDLATFNDHLCMLLDGEAIRLPKFNFVTGIRGWCEEPVKISEKSLIIIEGIHGLNPRLTKSISDKYKAKIYVSPMTPNLSSGGDVITTTDMRLIRRMVRDNSWRGIDAEGTLARWSSVMTGEHKYIEPFEERADFMLDTALKYEVSALKDLVVPLLNGVAKDVAEYDEAQRLLVVLSKFTSITPDYIPVNSILREFIGGSSFSY